MSNDFVLSAGGKSVNLLNSDIDDWNITFVDTGTTANIGQRLKAVQQHVAGEETFMANYADGLSDLHLPDLIDFHHRQQADATFLSVKPTHSFHTVDIGSNGQVQNVLEICKTDVWMNAGFFVLNQAIFDSLHEGEELVCEPFQRLIEQRKLSSMKYEGFFGCMDTYKEKQMLDDLYARGNTPWTTWKQDQQKPSIPFLGSGKAMSPENMRQFG